jgi:hypothetical protein
MLYSKLRKAVRQLNRFTYEFYRKVLKEIKISFIYRLVEFTENSYKRPAHQRTQQEITALSKLLAMQRSKTTFCGSATTKVTPSRSKRRRRSGSSWRIYICSRESTSASGVTMAPRATGARVARGWQRKKLKCRRRLMAGRLGQATRRGRVKKWITAEWQINNGSQKWLILNSKNCHSEPEPP